MTALDFSIKRRLLRQGNRRYGASLEFVPEREWPEGPTSRDRVAVLRSRLFLVQVFKEPGGMVRLSVNTCELNRDGNFKDDIRWDDLQQIKRECGYGNQEAIEIFPADEDLVNVANMRHLWVLPEKTPFSWKKREPQNNPCVTRAPVQ